MTTNVPVSTPFARPEAGASSRKSRLAAHLLALLGYLAATFIFTWPLTLNLTAAIPGDSFDGWQNYWNLWWIKSAVVERLVSPLFTDMLYAPTGVGLYFQTLNPFNGLTTLPIQLTAGLIPAYNTAVLLAWVLAGYGMFLLARYVAGDWGGGQAGRWTGAWAGPFLAGLVYTLSPFHMAHLLGHMQVMSLQWLPFYVLYLLRAQRQSARGQPWLRSALLAGLFLSLNALCDWYFVLYLLLFTGLAVLWQWWAGDRLEGRRIGTAAGGGAFQLRPLWRLLWQALKPPLVAATLFVVLLSPWLAPMVQEARQFQFMVRPPSDLYIFSASVADFFVPNRLHTLFRPGSFTWIGNQIAPVSEHTIAIGYVALAMAVAALLTAWRKATFWWVAAVFFLLMALGPQWHLGNITQDDIPPAVLQGQAAPSFTLYGLLNQWVPFMRISRSVSRFALMVQLCMAVLAAIGLRGLLSWLQRRWGQQPAWAGVALSTGLVVLLLAEYWVAPYPLSPPDTPGYYAQLAADPDSRAVLNLPMNYDRPGYLLYQTVHGKPLTVAYISRDDPRTLTERAPVLQHLRHLGPDIVDVDAAQIAPTVLADLGVGTVVLDRYKMPGGLERTYTEALAQQIFAGQQPTYADDRLTVYKVAAPDVRQPYVRLGALNWGPYHLGTGGAPERSLTGGPAAVEVLHAPGQGALRLRIRYRTQGDAGAAVNTLDGATLGRLPPAAQGGEAVFDLPPATQIGSELLTGLTLTPDAPGAVIVEQLQLNQAR